MLRWLTWPTGLCKTRKAKSEPRPFPTLKINPEKKDIDSFEFSDFEIVGYDPCPRIEMKMAV